MAMFDDQSQQGGLLGFMSTPAGQGLLSAVATGLATARRGRPLNNIGSGLLGGVQGYQQATENQNTNSLKNIQLQQAQQAMERQKQILELQKRFATPAGGAAMGAVATQGNTPGGFDGDGNYTAPVNNLGPTNAAAAVAPQTKPGFDYAGYSDALASIDPNAALAMKASLLKDSPFNKIDLKDVDPASAEMFRKTGNYGDLKIRSKKEFAPNGQLVDVYSTPQGSAFSDPNQPFTTGSNGAAVPNLPYQQFQLSKAKAGATKNVVSVNSRQETEYAKDQGKQYSELMASINRQGFSAPSQLRKLERMDQLLAGVDGGKLAPTGVELASGLNSIGIKVDPRLGNKEAAIALAKELAGGLRQPGTGPMTDKDFDNFLAQIPDLSKTAQGRKQITSTMRASLNRDMQISKMAREYVRKNGSLDNGFMDEAAQYIAENPVVSAPQGWTVEPSDKR
jgi:hypothetical protein